MRLAEFGIKTKSVRGFQRLLAASHCSKLNVRNYTHRPSIPRRGHPGFPTRGLEMKQPEPKLSDILEYLRDMSEAMMKFAAIHNLTLLAHIYGQAALEAKLELDAIAANEP
jgi:hypothetical protein